MSGAWPNALQMSVRLPVSRSEKVSPSDRLRLVGYRIRCPRRASGMNMIREQPTPEDGGMVTCPNP